MKAVFDLAKKYYPQYWSKERLDILLAKKKLTQKEYDELTKDKQQMQHASFLVEEKHMVMRGIDISKWQSGIDLSAVNADFVIVKATEGIGYVDKSCDGFFQKALSLGKKLGFYHFARPTANNDPIREADFFQSS